ncbi:hypothetical protein AALB53_08295 [Lachnospiraceae bacterium 47-T17]
MKALEVLLNGDRYDRYRYPGELLEQYQWTNDEMIAAIDVLFRHCLVTGTGFLRDERIFNSTQLLDFCKKVNCVRSELIKCAYREETDADKIYSCMSEDDQQSILDCIGMATALNAGFSSCITLELLSTVSGVQLEAWDVENISRFFNTIGASEKRKRCTKFVKLINKMHYNVLCENEIDELAAFGYTKRDALRMNMQFIHPGVPHNRIERATFNYLCDLMYEYPLMSEEEKKVVFLKLSDYKNIRVINGAKTFKEAILNERRIFSIGEDDLMVQFLHFMKDGDVKKRAIQHVKNINLDSDYFTSLSNCFKTGILHYFSDESLRDDPVLIEKCIESEVAPKTQIIAKWIKNGSLKIADVHNRFRHVDTSNLARELFNDLSNVACVKALSYMCNNNIRIDMRDIPDIFTCEDVCMAYDVIGDIIFKNSAGLYGRFLCDTLVKDKDFAVHSKTEWRKIYDELPASLHNQAADEIIFSAEEYTALQKRKEEEAVQCKFETASANIRNATRDYELIRNIVKSGFIKYDNELLSLAKRRYSDVDFLKDKQHLDFPVYLFMNDYIDPQEFLQLVLLTKEKGVTQ